MSIGADAPAAGAGGGSGPGEADRVLLLALRAWAPAGRAGMGDPSDGDPHARLLARLEPSWARRVPDEHAEGTTGAGDRAEARERLREAHWTEARVRPGASTRAGWPAACARNPRPSAGRSSRRRRADPISRAGGAPARQRRPECGASGRSRGPVVGERALDRAAGRRRAPEGRRPAGHRRHGRPVSPGRISALPIRRGNQAGAGRSAS